MRAHEHLGTSKKAAPESSTARGHSRGPHLVHLAQGIRHRFVHAQVVELVENLFLPRRDPGPSYGRVWGLKSGLVRDQSGVVKTERLGTHARSSKGPPLDTP